MTSSISSQKDSSDYLLRHTVPHYSSHRNQTKACACASITELSTSRPSITNTQFHKTMTCLTSFGEQRYFPNWICGPDTGRYSTNGGQFHPQSCLPNSIRVIRASGNAVRTHQRTGNVPSRNKPNSMPPLGRMCGGIPGRYPHLLARHAAARPTPATRLRHSSWRTILRQIIQERIRPRESPIPRTHGERSRSSRCHHEDQRRTHVKDTQEREGVAAVPRLCYLLQQVHATVRENRNTTHESAEEEHSLQVGTKTSDSRGATETSTHVRTVPSWQTPNATTSSKLTLVTRQWEQS
ncbi:hypothetical protein CLOM_g5316 [Closterium sp. NIES-68]|nr:hypothetical protein CLOM_g5316 [Closterium sp. NIES-68]